MANPVVVVGGGISGLAVTYALVRAAAARGGDVEPLCLEAGARPGGNIRTDREGGFLLEWGPTGFLDNAPATLELARQLGLEDEILRADKGAARRFIFRKRKLHRVPEGPFSLLTSGLLSWRGKLRLLLEPVSPARKRAGDESVLEFARRRIGKEAARVLVDAMVAGIFAGDAAGLSLPAAFPKMRQMETEHGSLFRAMLSHVWRRRTTGGPSGPGGTLTSFRAGLETFPRALARELGPALALGRRVAAVADMGVRGLRVFLEEGAPIDASAVVLACPAWHAAGLVSEMDPGLGGTLAAIPSAPVAVVHLGFLEGVFPERPVGFGFLVPRGEGPRILGTLWSSSIFPGRSPDGKTLVTTMIGGAHDPTALELSDAELVAATGRDVRAAMSFEADPVFARVFRHARGIPQYTLGHLDRLEAIEGRRREHPGLFFCGNSYRGISMNSCIEEAPRIAASVVRYLAARRTTATSS